MILSAQQLDEAEAAILAGKVIIFPTETSYALGCDATNEQAVARIFAIKGRDEGKGLPLLIPSAASASEYIETNALFDDFASRFWPGALNIIGTVKKTSPVTSRCAQNGTQSVRVSSHPFASTLVRRLNRPLTATSANISGQDAMYSTQGAEMVFASAKDLPDLVIDAGQLPVTPASTTVNIASGSPVIIRQGGIVL